MKIAYLVNQYPRLSHSFIRREITALEAAGATVRRFSLRGWAGQQFVDPRDRAELDKTRVILQAGVVGLLWATLTTALSRPGRLLRTLWCAWRIGKRSERGRLVHLVYVMEACVLRRWLADDQVTHLHAHFGTNSTTVAMFTRLLGGPPYSFTSHGPKEYDQPQFISLGEKIRHAAFVVAISQYGKSQCYRWCEHEHWSRIHVVHCGVDELFLDPQAAPPPMLGVDGASPRKLICIGRLAEQKGQLLLVEAAALLAQRGGNFHLTLIGDGEMRGPIEQLIQRHALHDRVTLAGWMSNDQVRGKLLESHALVLPSFAEGLPVVIMESLALHRPVLSTYVAGIPELVVPGECGWLVPAGSVQALTDTLAQVLCTGVEELQRMGAAGAARVRQHHDARIEGEKLLALVRASQSTHQPSTME